MMMTNKCVVMIDGFFDAGMLQQALKARQQGHYHHSHNHDSSSDDRSNQSRQRRSRRDVGKKLPLIDY